MACANLFHSLVLVSGIRKVVKWFMVGDHTEQ